MFSENEHTFEKYKRYKYIYNFGEPKYSDWERDGVKTYLYDQLITILYIFFFQSL